MEDVPIRKVVCPVRSEAFPLTNLMCGKRWEPDFPTQRASLLLRLGDASTTNVLAFFLHEVHLRCRGVTHVELRTLPSVTESGLPALDDDRGAELIQKIELVSMFDYKRQHQSSLPHDDTHTLQATLPVSAEGRSVAVRNVVLTLLCLWEPSRPIAIESLTLRGQRADAKPWCPEVYAASSLHEMLPMKRPRVEVAPAMKAEVTTSSAPSALPPPPPLSTSSPSKPLSGCVVVLSGFVNPLRAELRDKALSLGAKVANDWGPGCTHLVAAIVNTPKYAQVRASGHGHVVAKEWVLHAFEAKARPSESTYRLVGDETSDPPAASATLLSPPAAAVDTKPPSGLRIVM